MFRLIFLVSAAVGFLRDYSFRSDIGEQFIFTVLVIEISAEIVQKTFILRMLNSDPKTGPYFSTSVLARVVPTIAAGSFIFANGIHLVGDALIITPLLAIVPVNTAYRYFAQYILNSKNYLFYYTQELVKSLLLLGSFLLLSPEMVGLSYVVVCASSITYFFFNKPIHTQIEGALKTVWSNFKNDISLQLQGLILLAAGLIDKAVVDGSGKPVLLFLLVSKFVSFAVKILNELFLQVWQIEERGENRKLQSILYISLGCIVTGILGSNVLFFFLIDFTPIAGAIVPDPLLIFAGQAWFASQTIRDTVVRWLYHKNRFELVGKTLTVAALCYLGYILTHPQAHAYEMVFVLVLLNLVVTAVTFYLGNKNEAHA